MDAQLKHEDIQELLGAYALNAVNNEERDLIDRHLLTCPRCREEVQEHRETAAILASHGDEAPEGLWSKITTEIEGAEPGKLADIRPFPPKPRTPWVLRIAAVAAAVMIALLSAKVLQQDQRIDEMAARVQSANRDGAYQALADPRSREGNLESPDKSRFAKVVWRSNGTGYVVNDNLEPLPRDRTYQLWALVGDKKVSAGVLGHNPGVVAFQITGSVDGFAITSEAAPGASSPTTPPAVVGFIEA